MPDFDRLHELSRKLAELTAPGLQEPGIGSWNVLVGETWKELVDMWGGDFQARPRRTESLERIADALERLALLKANPQRKPDGQ